jgi:hypothetical protein
MLNLLSSLPTLSAPLPYQTSQPQCLNPLTQAAIAQNLELQTIDDRLKATQTRIDQQRRGKWKTWVQPNPIGIVANILGGGDAQRMAQAANAQRLQVIEVGYKFGRGSTVEMMALWQAAEVEKSRIWKVERDRVQQLNKLAGITGYAINQMDTRADDRRSIGDALPQPETSSQASQ